MLEMWVVLWQHHSSSSSTDAINNNFGLRIQNYYYVNLQLVYNTVLVSVSTLFCNNAIVCWRQ